MSCTFSPPLLLLQHRQLPLGNDTDHVAVLSLVMLHQMCD